MPERIAIEMPMSKEAEEFVSVGAASPAMRSVENIATEIAGTSIPVLIVGENGTGKQVLARWIHQNSQRRELAVLGLACATLNAETLSGQLRLSERKAPFAGTVILDEVAELSRECQQRLLHSLPDDDATVQSGRTPARIISTTTERLEEGVRAGRFRADLYYRLNGVCLRIPALHERREDIPALVEVLLSKHSTRLKKPRPEITQTGLDRLVEHPWHGNVRELENAVQKIVALGEELGLADLDAAPGAMRFVQSNRDERSLKSASRAASQAAERDLILKTLTRTQWNRKRAAQELRVSYKSLLYKIKQIGLPGPEHQERKGDS
jgi:DNA-binding NtrC family response regulator